MKVRDAGILSPCCVIDTLYYSGLFEMSSSNILYNFIWGLKALNTTLYSLKKRRRAARELANVVDAECGSLTE